MDTQEMIYQAISEASMCWSETPKGIFDSDRAKAIGDSLIARVEELIARVEELERALKGDLVFTPDEIEKWRYPKEGE